MSQAGFAAAKREIALPSGYTTRIICLANSRKPGGRCVAGKAIQNKAFGEWVRPVSARAGGELSHADRQFSGGVEPALLDVISIDMLGKASHPYQPENHTIDERAYWQLIRRASFNEALPAVDPRQPDLWGTTFGSSYSGTNDRVPVANASSFNYSLRLIKVDDLRIQVSAEGAAFGNMKRKLRGHFTYSQHHYALSITCPLVEAQYLAGQDGSFDVGNALLCVSLSEPHQGYAYKLIASVILPP
jgi:hypothetical protein